MGATFLSIADPEVILFDIVKACQVFFSEFIYHTNFRKGGYFQISFQFLTSLSQIYPLPPIFKGR